MKKEFPVKLLGAARIPSPLPLSCDSIQEEFQFVNDDSRILHDVAIRSSGKGQKHFSFEQAGPRSHSYFDASKVRAGIVTCGGLCPGINNVIRTIVMQLHHNYGVHRIHGFRYGFQGFIPSYQHEIVDLKPANVLNIHNLGGSILSSSRGPQDPVEMVDCLERNNIRILYCIGGDGTLCGAHAIAEEVGRRKKIFPLSASLRLLIMISPTVSKPLALKQLFQKQLNLCRQHTRKLTVTTTEL